MAILAPCCSELDAVVKTEERGSRPLCLVTYGARKSWPGRSVGRYRKSDRCLAARRSAEKRQNPESKRLRLYYAYLEDCMERSRSAGHPARTCLLASDFGGSLDQQIASTPFRDANVSGEPVVEHTDASFPGSSFEAGVSPFASVGAYTSGFGRFRTNEPCNPFAGASRGPPCTSMEGVDNDANPCRQATAELKRYRSDLNPTRAVPGTVGLSCEDVVSIGCKALPNDRPRMEDAHSAQKDFARLWVACGVTSEQFPPCIDGEKLSSPSRAPMPPLAGLSGSDTISMDSDCSTNCSSSSSVDMVHYAGVFDGHGGDEAAKFCSQHMPKLVREHLDLLGCLGGDGDMDTMSADYCEAILHEPSECRADDVAASCSSEAASALNPVMHPSGVASRTESQMISTEGFMYASGQDAAHVDPWTPKVIGALERAFQDVDNDLRESLADRAGCTGTTALVALVGSRQLFIAHCGDSRAVLCRDGQAHPLTSDHKPDREDEERRVKEAGGKVLNCNGQRVMGILAMSRAIGDVTLRPYVIPSPEITVVNRQPGDELLILGTDGLWDTLPNKDAVELAKKAVERAALKGARRGHACRIAATVLAAAAVERGSRDNITVVVIDLQGGQQGEATAAAKAATSAGGSCPAVATPMGSA